MATTVVKNYNIAPYYDDFDETKNYHRILFKPGYSVQARELTQLQTSLQAQIDRHGQYAFKDGSRVVNGKATLNVQYDFIKIESTFWNGTASVNSDAYLNDFVGTKITGTVNTTNQVVAEVKAVVASEGSDPNTLYIEYEASGGANNTVQKFVAGELFQSDGTGTPFGMVGGGTNIDNSNTASSITNPIGQGSSVAIEEGVYFISGSFVYVPAGTLILDKYTNTPNYIVGLKVTESTISSDNDTDLVDNAQGSPNYSAPGADRYQISTQLIKQDLDLANRTENSMITLLEVVNGQAVVDKTDAALDTELSERLARRTFEESGDYSINPYQLNIREYLNDNTNNGYKTTAQIIADGDAGNTSDATAFGKARLAIGVEPNVAYVKGFRVENTGTKYVTVNKPRGDGTTPSGFVDSTRDVNLEQITLRVGNYVKIKTTSPAPVGMPDINDFDTIDLHDATAGGGSVIGTARVRGFDFTSSELRLYIFDIAMTGSNNFSSVVSVQWSDGGTVRFRGDLDGTTIYDGANSSLVYKLPYNAIKSLYSPGESTTNTSLVVKQKNITNAGTMTFQLGSGNFANTSSVVAAVVPTGGAYTSATIDTSPTCSINGDTITFTDVGGTTSLTGSQQIIFIADVSKSGAVQKQKNRRKSSDNYSGTTVGPSALTNGELSLAKADIIQINSILDANNEDVSSRFTLDNGQRDNYYGVGKIKLKPGQSDPGNVTVKFDFYDHQSGDFFTADSYPSDDYDSIPIFYGIKGLVQLRDCIDFRPRFDDDGADFTTTGSSLTDIPADSSLFTADITHFLPRIDKLIVTRTGEFKTVTGVPSENPVEPEVPNDAMGIYDLRLAPYTFTTNGLKPKLVENKRYTMRDIGRIEKRVKNLEYYTSLSLLEASAASTQIMSGSTERLKNGFIVDSFLGHSIGDSGNPDYAASVDKTQGHLRPKFDERNVNLIRLAGEANGTSGKAKKSKSIVTLPFTETNYVNQPYSSTFSNVNPYSVFSWAGTIELSPDTDEWKEVDVRPPVIIDDSSQYEQFKKMAEEDGILGTVWNEWETNWSGVDVSTETSGGTGREFLDQWWWINGEPEFGIRNGVNNPGFGGQNTTTTTTTTTQQQSRSGINTDLTFDTITKSDGVHVVQTNFIPFIRSREIHFRAELLKPNTQVYAFFDGTDVSDFVREDTFAEFTDQASVDTFEGETSYPTSLNASGAGALITNGVGIVEGSFVIPRNDALKFATGSREFRLTDNSDNNRELETTYAEGQYFAQGLLDITEERIISTKIPRLVTSEVREDRTVVETEVSETTEWVDPVAETFLVDKAGGLFLNSVDLYFKRKPPAKNDQGVEQSSGEYGIPVRVTIRTTRNGFPTQRIVPGGDKVVYAADVNVSNDASTATNFAFDYPVYLTQDTEYAVVITAMTDLYEVYVAEMGGFDITDTTKRITKQPYNGVFFSSANASTWTPEQSKDLKFKLNRCSFNTSDHTLTLTNDVLPTKKLTANPFYFTSGSGNVVVSHKNHGMYNTDAEVTISGVASGTYNGIAHTALNGNHSVTAFTHDTYTIAVGSNANATGYAGGAAVRATENRHIDVMYPVIQNMQVPGTSIDFYATTHAGRSVSGTEGVYVQSAEYQILPNKNFYFSRPQLIGSAREESENMSGNKSFNLRCVLSTTDEALSPVIDMSRCSVNTVQNIISANNGLETSASGGAEVARYITKVVDLNDQADVAEVYINALKPAAADIDLYFRITTGDEDIGEVAWTEATPSDSIPSNSSRFSEVKYVINPTDLIGSIQFKIVMKSTISSLPPIIKDFRAICAT